MPSTVPFAGNCQISFAGMELDNESQLYHTLYRYYNPRLGLWMTTDPAGMAASNLGDPQSLNRYAYVSGNPMNFVDPLGLSKVLVFTTLVNGCLVEATYNVEGTLISTNVVMCGVGNGGGGGGNGGGGGGNGGGGGGTAANNHSWAWNFAKSFFTFAGGPGNVPTCAGQALRHMGEILNPFTPGASTATEAAAPVAQAVAINQGIAQTQAGIDAYVAARGLTVPLRSSVVRAMATQGAEGAVAAGARANLAVQTLAVDYAAVNSTITTAGEARRGQCASAFPIF